MDSEIERLRKKVENFPSASLYNRLAELLRNSGALVEADAVCRRCIKEFPRSSQAYVILAEMVLATGKRTEAAQYLRTAVEKDPRSYTAHRMLADLAENREIAIQHLRAILAFKPNDPAAMQRIADLGGNSQPPTDVIHAAGAQPQPAAPGTASFQAPGTGSFSSSATRSFSAGGGAGAGHSSSGVRQAVNRDLVLDQLCRETGVRGALIVDLQGRVLLAKGCDGKEDAVAAIAADLARAAAAALHTTGAPAPVAWSLACALGQVLVFSRAGGWSVVTLAEPQVRPAMLELRARQALIDLSAD